MKSHCAVALLFVLSGAACGKVTEKTADARFSPDPASMSLDPVNGALAGSTTVILTGSGFTENGAEPNQVIVGTRQATDVTVMSDTQLSFVTPPGVSVGAVDVVVFNSNGFGKLEDGYSYNAVPTATSASPDEGDISGGDVVVIEGSGFTANNAGSVSVKFGDTDAANIDVISDNMINATTPVFGGTAFSPTDITVSNNNGTATLDGAFYFTKPGLLGSNNRNGFVDALYYIDPGTGASMMISHLTERVVILATDTDGTIYGVNARVTTSDRFLSKIDWRTGQVTRIGGPITTSSLSGLAFVNGSLYGLRGRSRQVLAVNKTDGTGVQVGVDFATTLLPAPAEANGSNMIVIRNLNEALKVVNVSTGVMTDGVTLLGPGAGCRGLARHLGILYCSTVHDPNTGESMLYTVDTGSGAVTAIGALPNGLDGLTDGPW